MPLRRRRIRIIDPKSPQPRLADPTRMPEDPFGPRSVSQHQDRKPLEPRLLALGGLGAVAVLALVYNLYSLQVQQAQRFTALAEGNRVREETLLAPRGILFDRHGTQLVTNQGSFAVWLVPADLPRPPSQREAVLQRLTRSTGI